MSAIAAVGALILFVVAKRGHTINTGKSPARCPRQIVIFSLGMYLVVYGLRNAGLTEYLSGVLSVLADNGLWARDARHRIPHRLPLFYYEQYADGTGWRVVH